MVCDMSVMKPGDTIMLENDDVFTVLETLKYKGKNYLYAVQAAENLIYSIDSQDLKIAILQEIVNAETEEVFVEQVIESELLDTLTKEFAEEMIL